MTVKNVIVEWNKKASHWNKKASHIGRSCMAGLWSRNRAPKTTMTTKNESPSSTHKNSYPR
jgi:hypothetical protein